MIEVRQTDEFREWHAALSDDVALAKVSERLTRLARGLYGDAKPVGTGVTELRIDHGPGYRVYLVRRGKAVVVVLGGGTKKTQTADINRAKALAKEIE